MGSILGLVSKECKFQVYQNYQLNFIPHGFLYIEAKVKILPSRFEELQDSFRGLCSVSVLHEKSKRELL